ncbi:hypothetical protein ACO2Q8_03805 [Larkinella sp. VNQ87]|uniref:hypothetical protein n=1 Tax=Larkinella sp. VNQ87 TaxID=3400921 RepID=UPI003BFEB73E
MTSCDPQSAGISPSDPVPVQLQVSAQPDSLLILPDDLDFSVVSKTGQGPGGTLIRWNLPGSPGNNFTAYTYDQQSRLIGSSEQTSFGYDQLRLVRYQGAYLAQVYTGFDYRRGAASPKRVDAIGWVSKYEYDAQHRLAQVLVYENVGGQFKLNHRIQYEYNASGELHLTRDTMGLAFGSSLSQPGSYPVEIRYWENGDVYRQEVYNPNQTPVEPTQRVFYNQVTNPRARLHVWPQNVMTVHYPIGTGVTRLDRETHQYRYGYDAQGRLSTVQQRSVTDYRDYDPRWTEWSYQEEFVYAP